MDPVTILSLVCNICQLCEYGTAALVMAKEVYFSERGLTEQHERLQSSTKSLEGLSGRLKVIKQGPIQTDDEKNLHDLAANCKEISCRILDLLEKIKGKKGHSMVSAMGVTVRDMRYRGKIEELQEKLRHLQDQVHLQLSVVLRSEVLERLETLIKSRNSDASELASLRENIQILRTGIKVTELGDEVSSQLLHLLNVSSEGIDRKCRDYLLKAISFSNMNKRYDQVEVAHEATFKWILEQDKLEVGDTFKKHNIQVGLRSWLSRGSGIFQIIAKPGAGKSTMMKVIYHSPETRKLLQVWAGRKRAIVAKFFFWKQDDLMQRSMDGLTRSLLHQILSEAPELIAECFPDQWRAIQNTPWHSNLVPELSNTETRQAFQKLLSGDNSKVWTSYSLCIFIDGLDECECKKGSQELVKSLQNLASVSTSIKICISSRVMNSLGPIEDAYPGQKIFLHRLTEPDIRRVVYDRLHDNSNFRRVSTEDEVGCRYAIDEVVQKAEGVFLWVTLILNILCQGLTDDDTLSDLRKKIDHYPEDLDTFLREIIRSIPTENRELAYRTFAITMVSSRAGANMRLFNYSFLEDYNSDKGFAMSIPLDGALSSEETAARLSRTRRRLTAHCKELLHVDDASHGPNAPIVSFVHRSVREIFEQEQVKNDMAEHTKNFDVLDAILQTYLAGIKHDPDCTFDGGAIRDSHYALKGLLNVVNFVQPRCTTATCESLDRLSTAVLHRQGIVAESFHEVEWRKYDVIDMWQELKSKRKYIFSLAHIAAQIGLFTYLDWTVNKFPDFARHHEVATELLWQYVCSQPLVPNSWSIGVLRWVESLFLRGLSANCPLFKSVEVDHRPIWYMLINELLHWGRRLLVRNYSWRLVEIFVRYGAHCSMTMKPEADGALSSDQDQVVVAWAGGTYPVSKGHKVLFELLMESSLGVVRLQDIVDSYAPENAATLKDLIIRNQARERESPSIVTLSNRDFEEARTAAIKAGKDVRKVKFRMRELNWDVSPPTAAELEAERFEKWATVWGVPSPTTATAVENRGTSSLGPDSSTFKPKQVSALAPEQTSLSKSILGHVVLGLPVLVLMLSTYLMFLSPLVWVYLFSSDSKLREL